MQTGFLAVLRNRKFLILTIGQTTSQVGNFFGYIAVMALLYRLTGSSLIVGTYMIAQAVASLLAGPVAGSLVDRFDRRRIMIASDLSRGALVLLLPFATAGWQVIAIATCKAVAAAFFNPARVAITPRILDKSELNTGISLSETVATASQIVGPALGGLFVGFAGVTPALMIDAATFFVSALSLQMLRGISGAAPGTVAERPAGGAQKPSRRWAWLAGYGAVLANRIYARLTCMKALNQIGASAINVVLVAFALDVLRVGNVGFGIMGTFLGSGLLLGSILNARVARSLRPFTIMGLSAILAGLALAGVGLAHIPMIAYALFLVTGAAIGLYNVSFEVVFQGALAEEQLGRAAAGTQVVDSVVNLTAMAGGGVLADLLGVRPVIIGSSILMSLTGVIGLGFGQEGNGAENDHLTTPEVTASSGSGN